MGCYNYGIRARNHVNNEADPTFTDAVAHAVADLLPTLTVHITDEIRENKNNGNNGNRRNTRRINTEGSCNDGDAQPTYIHVWLERFQKQKPQTFSSASTPYFPYSEKEKCEQEYKSIRQLLKETSTDFMNRFLRLAGFLGAKAGTQEEQAKHFKWGLNNFILDRILNIEFTDVAQVANAPRNIEIFRDRPKNEGNNKRDRDGHYIQPSDTPAQRSNQRAYDRRDSDRYGNDDRYGNRDSMEIIKGVVIDREGTNIVMAVTNGVLVLKGCGVTRINRATGACFECGKVGHLAKDCMKGSTRSRGNKNNKPQATSGRVFALTTEQAANIPDNALSISTPMLNSVIISYEFRNCPLRIGDDIRFANFLPLEMSDFDIILGMDWLTEHRATIDCHLKRVIFGDLKNPEFIYHGSRPRLPPMHKVEFTVELIPGAQPISKASYIMFYMASLANKAILSGAENRPSMLEKDTYDSWRSRIELYMLNRQHDRMILESVEHGPLLCPSITEDRVTRLKKYSELSSAEAIQADCDVKATHIILQRLPSEIYALERECKLHDAGDKFAYQKGETLRDFYLKFSLLLNDMNMYNMKLEQFHVNRKFLNTLPPEWSKFVTDVNLQQASTYQSSPYTTSYHTPQFVPQRSSSSNLLISYPVNDTSSTVNHNAYIASAPQIDYAPIAHHPSEFSSPKTRLVVSIFQKGDDPIDAINHMMSFLTSVVTSKYPATNNQLRTSSNPRQQAIINDGRVTIQPIQGRQNHMSAGLSRPFASGSGGTSGRQRVIVCYNCKGEGHIAKQCTKPKRKRDEKGFKVKVLQVQAQANGHVLQE
nr:hypothetical protein [Tanacetum cinerariifolium]